VAGAQNIYKQPARFHIVVDERSAGAVLFYYNGDRATEPEFLLLNYTAGHWDFPKGNIERGELEKEAASREIREETGITDVEFLDGFRMKIEYRYRHGKRLVLKEVVLFLGRSKTKHVVLSHEHVGFAWKTYAEAMARLTYRNAKDLLSAAREFLQQKSIAYHK
jgi:8-oxo-dGTP pyrophosphatase MutT (NUDIX family)